MSARVLFIQPPYVTHVVAPPLGIGYLASYLEREGHQVRFLDLNLSGLDTEGLRGRLREFGPDVVGISLMCTGMQEARSLVETVKSTLGAKLVIGGAQASALPEFCLQYTGADFIVAGEGEGTISELVSALEGGRDCSGIPGLGFWNGDAVQVNPRRPLIEDIDSLPFPAWHLMPPRRYRIAPVLSSAKRFPIAPIVTSRGCPFNCSFCAGKAIWGRNYRYRSAVSVVDEIEMLIRRFGAREIFLSDDNFTLSAEHASGVCEEILKRRLRVHWACPNGVRIDTLTPELLSLMKRAGCHLIGLGIESGSQEVLNKAKKKLDLAIVNRVCRYIDSAGIKAVGFFILGLEGETGSSVQETIDFARSLPLRRAWFNMLQLFPGSQVFEDYTSGVAMDMIDWERPTDLGVEGTRPSCLTEDELTGLQRKAAWSFYARPRILIDVLLSQRPATVSAFFRTQFIRNMLAGKRP